MSGLGASRAAGTSVSIKGAEGGLGNVNRYLPVADKKCIATCMKGIAAVVPTV